MEKRLIREKLLDEIHFSSLTDPKFKQNRISVNLVVPLRRESVTTNALIPLLLRRGYAQCPDFTSLNQRLSALYGAVLDADVGKAGDFQLLSLSIRSLDDRYALEGESVIRGCAELLCGLLLDPKIEGGRFDREDVAIECRTLREIIQSEINDKRTYALRRAEEVMYGTEACGLSKYGYVEDIDAITPDSAGEAYRRLLHTARIEILFVGPGDPSVAKEIFAGAFERIYRDPDPTIRMADIRPATALKEKTDCLEVTQAKLVLGFRPKSKDALPTRDASRLMAAIYGGTPISRLFMHVREEKSLCYYCAARYDSGKGVMMVDSGVEMDKVEEAKAAILEQFAIMQRGAFTEDELRHSILALQNNYRTVPDSAAALELCYLAQILEGCDRTLEEAAEAIGRLTREDVVQAANAFTLDTVYLLKGGA